LRFDWFGSTYDGANVSAASLNMFNIWAYTCTPKPFLVYRVDAAWDPGSTTTWPGPAVGSWLGDVTAAPGAACTNTSLDYNTGTWMNVPLTTDTFDSWALGGANNGLAVRSDEGDSTHWKKFCSARCGNAPYLTVTYTPNEVPQVNGQYPPFGHSATTLTPQLLVSASDADGWPEALSYNFQVYDKDGNKVVESGPTSSGAWTVPEGNLRWGENYSWTVVAWDGNRGSTSQTINLLSTPVPQPEITSGLSQNGGQGFEPSAGNYTTTGMDAAVATVGPALAIQRAYNSLDARTNSAFGVGWSTLADVSARVAASGSGARDLVVIRYPTGQEVAFGRNGDGSYAPPKGRFATLTAISDGGYQLVDKDGTIYRFTQAAGTDTWRVASVADAAGRTQTFTYNAEGQLTTITSASGRALHLTWTATTGGRVATVTTDPATPGDTSTALTWNYSYDGDQLTAVCPPTTPTKCTTYSYADASLYRAATANAGPRSSWRLAESEGSVAVSDVPANEGTDNGTYTDVTLGADGPLSGSTTTAAQFNGTGSVLELPNNLVIGSSFLTLSMWFKTSSSGILFVEQNQPMGAGEPSHATPSLYVGTDGKLHGVWYQQTMTQMVSEASVNDDTWHHAALSGAGSTQTLYLDGAAVGTLDGQIDNLDQQHVFVGAGWSSAVWPGLPPKGESYFPGSISEVALFDRPLSGEVVSGMYTAGRTTAKLLTSVRRPSGNATAEVTYDPATARVAEVTDASGGTWAIGSPTVTGSSQVYVSSVLAGRPADYWRLAETGTTTAINQVHGNDATYNEVTLGVSDGVFDDATVASFNGTSSYLRLPDTDVPTTGPNSVSMWFKMPEGSTAGGVLFGYQTTDLADSDSSAEWVPSLYIGTDGKLRGHYWIGDSSGMPVSDAVNDGQWHHVALAASTSSQQLYLDGAKVGSAVSGALVTTTAARAHVGAGKWLNWPATAGSIGYFPGAIAEVAYYPAQLSDAQVLSQFVARSKSSGVPVSTVTVTDPAGDTSTSSFDASIGRRVAMTDARGGTIRYGYDVGGFLRTVTDPNGNVVITEHDVRGNTVSSTTCQNQAADRCSTVYFTYHPDATTKILSPDPRNDQLLTVRDARSASATDDTYRTTYAYDEQGNRTSVTDALGRVTTTGYTDGTTVAAADGGFAPAGLPSTLTTAGNAQQTVTYFANGDVASVTDPAGKVTSMTYDGLGRALTSTDVTDTHPEGLTTSVTYDGLGRVLAQTDPPVTNRVTGAVHTAVTTTVYDDDGLVTSQTVADATGGDASRTTSAVYNEHGLATSTTDAADITTRYEYDAFGRVVTQTDPDGQVQRTTYTPTGDLLTSSLDDYTGDPNDPSEPQTLVLEARTYDPAGRLASVTDTMGWQTAYAYTDNNLPVTTTRVDPTSGAQFVQEHNAYDAAGNLASQTTNDGRTTTEYTVDPSGRTTATVLDPDGLGRRTTYGYSDDDHVTATTRSDAAGNVLSSTSATYDPLGRVTSQSVVVEDDRLITTSWTLDQAGLATAMTDPMGETTTYAYDSASRLVMTVAPETTVEIAGADPVRAHPMAAVGYNTFGEQVETSDANGNVTVVTRDAAGRVRSSRAPPYTPLGATEPITAETITEYNNIGKVTAVTEPKGRTTTYAYDQLDRVSKVTTPDTGETTFTYDLLGDQLTVTDPTGAVTAATYDWLGRQLTSSQAVRQTEQTHTTTYAYGEGGWLASTTSPDGVTTSATYDATGQPLTASDGAGNTTAYAYDGVGRLARTTWPDGTASGTTYDLAGRPVAGADYAASGTALRSTSSTYDDNNSLVTSTDARSTTTTFTYDGLGRLVGQIEPVSASESVTSSFAYDAVGNRTRFTDGRGNAFWTEYTPWNLPESQIEPATVAHPAAADRTFSVVYDEAGQLVSSLMPGGVSVTNSYDDAGQLVRMSGSGAETDTADRVLGYDLAGRITSVSGTGGTNTFSYDDRDLLLSTSGPSGTSSFAYTADGAMDSRTDAAGTTDFRYDTAGRLSTIANPAAGVGVTIAYNQLSQAASMAYGSEQNTRTFGYDELHRPTSDELTTAAGESVARVDYGWDANDNLTSKATVGFGGAGTTTANAYTYDLADRLTSWDNGVTTTSYGYDASGNRVSAGEETATYDERNRLVSAGTTTYTYTARGTLASASTSAGVLETQTDPFGQVVSQEYAPGQASTYTYDGLGRLLQDGLAYTGVGNTLAADGDVSYVRDPGGQLVGASSSDGTSQRLLWTDQHSDVVGQFTVDGAALAGSAVYDPWGEVLSSAGMLGNLGFQSGWTDPDTGRVNMRSRWYNPDTGQFDTRDAANVSPMGNSIGANRYAYGSANPLANVDSDGTWSFKSLAKSAVNTVSRAARSVVNTVVSVARAVYNHVILPVVRAVVNVVTAVVRAVVKVARTATRWVKSTVSRAKSWVSRKASAARAWAAKKAAAARAKAKAAVARAKAAAKAEIAKAQRVYAQARQKVVDAYQASATWVAEHKDLLIEIAAVGAGIVAGLACTAATGGVGAVACMAGAMALVNLAKDAAQGNVNNWGDAFGSLGKGAAQGLIGGVAGAVGGKVATFAARRLGGAAASLGGRLFTGAVAGGVEDAVTQYATTGAVDWSGVGLAAGAGAVFGVRGPKVGAGGRGGGANPSAPRRGDGDSGGQSPGRGSGNGDRGPAPSRGENSDISGSCPWPRAGHSFDPNTRVVMADGSTKPIGDIQIGDQVRATDPTSGQTGARTVTVLHRNQDTDLTDVTVGTTHGASGGTSDGASTGASTGASNGDGSGTASDTTVLRTTQHHPFWDATVGAWVLAANLVPGHELHTGDGDTVTVVSVVNRDVTTGGQDMRDLTVADLHTYYVVAGTVPVLVHNCNTIDPNEARFTQDSVGSHFKSGHSIDETAAALADGSLD
ncbi:MAG: hypothetical protein KJO75_09220, partial [Dactylosporangium sp.]|nr:hypothetical protein [Dactylosporangium sp.]